MRFKAMLVPYLHFQEKKKKKYAVELRGGWGGGGAILP